MCRVCTFVGMKDMRLTLRIGGVLKVKAMRDAAKLRMSLSQYIRHLLSKEG